MNNDPVKSFGNVATGLSKNPLGIIALFIVLIYCLAAMVITFSTSLTQSERLPFVYFLVLFPVLVLGLFSWIVVRYPVHLFGPRDFRNEENYVTLVASLTAASFKPPHTSSSVDVHEIAQTARTLSTSVATGASPSRNHILWVDDCPENNIYERQAFESLGLTFTFTTSTRQGIEMVKSNLFAAIISDMARKEGPQEGYVLLETLRKQGNKTSFFIYSSSDSAEHKREAARRGAQGSTNNPQELIRTVTTTIVKGSANWSAQD
jgi:CheY-like chemotaxis protein